MAGSHARDLERHVSDGERVCVCVTGTRGACGQGPTNRHLLYVSVCFNAKGKAQSLNPGMPREQRWIGYLLHGERRANLLSSEDHGALGQHLRELEGVQAEQLADVADNWKKHTCTNVSEVACACVSRSGVSLFMWNNTGDIRPVGPTRSAGNSAPRGRWGRGGKGGRGGLQFSAGTVVHWFFGKEVAHSKQRRLELMLQPVQSRLLLQCQSNSGERGVEQRLSRI